MNPDSTNLQAPATGDQEILKQLRERQEPALIEVYHRYQRAVYSLALYLVGEETKARSLTQEIFLHIWERASHFDASRGSLESWILTLTHHRAIEILRNERTAIASHKTSEREASTSDIPRRSWDLKKAFAEKLPIEQQEVITLAYYNGMTLTEISESLSIPVETVRHRLSAGMHLLHDLLQQPGNSNE